MASDPHVFDELKLAFVFVPHGAPEPTEWLTRHPDYIKLPATFVPRGRGDDRARSSSGSPLGQRGTVDGLAVASGTGAPWPPSGNTRSDAASAGTSEGPDRAVIGDDPIAAFLLADEGLVTAASDYPSGRAGGSKIDAHGYVGNNPLNLTDPLGPRAGTLRGRVDANYEVIGGGITSRIPGSYQEAAELSGYATYYNLPGNTTASGQPLDPNGMDAAMTGNRAPLGTNVQVRLQSDPSNSISVQIDDTGPFARGSNGQPLHPLQPDPNIIIDLTPHAFDVLTHNNRALGRVPVIVTVPDQN